MRSKSSSATSPSRSAATKHLLAIIPMLERREQARRGQKLPTTLRAIVEEIAAQHGVRISTVWRWYGRFLRYGFTGLSHTIRADAGQSRFAKKNPEIWQMIRARNGHSAFAIFKSLRAVLGPHSPSYPTVQFLCQLEREARRRGGMQEAA